jgi:hypothetical protein
MNPNAVAPNSTIAFPWSSLVMPQILTRILGIKYLCKINLTFGEGRQKAIGKRQQ